LLISGAIKGSAFFDNRKQDSFDICINNKNRVYNPEKSHGINSFHVYNCTTTMAESRKRKILTLEKRVDVIKRNEKGQSCRSIAAELQVGKTQIQSIIRDKDEIMKMWTTGSVNSDAKFFKVRKTTYHEIDSKLWEWFCSARSKNIPITGPLIQQEALMLSVSLGCDEFAASNGWLQSFLKRHNIKSCVLSGEAASVREEDVQDWIKRLSSILEGYKLKDIFNADETGLFFRTLPTKSYVVKGDRCTSGKNSKERLTVLLACSAEGEKLKPLVIGKSTNPRCFRGYQRHSLPVIYKNNKKSWMTSTIFQEWINTINNKMKIQKRKILLLVDNCPAHPPVDASNVKLVFLPPNTTSRLQPCDAGIIRSFKAHYRKRLLRHILVRMDEASEAAELAKQVTLIDCILWVDTAWKSITADTIRKCFSNCGIGERDTETPATPEEAVTLDEAVLPLLDGTTWEDFTNCDEDTTTTTETTTETTVTTETEKESSNEDEEEPETTLPEPPISVSAALNSLKTLQTFGLQNNLPDIINLMNQAEELIEKNKWETLKEAKQTKLDSFFKQT
jgi:hypothetical protein